MVVWAVEVNAMDRSVVVRDAVKSRDNVPAERRRPGRPDVVSPALIPLLRTHDQINPQLYEQESEPQFDDPDPLRPARGLAFALVASLLLWGFLGGLGWLAVGTISMLGL